MSTGATVNVSQSLPTEVWDDINAIARAEQITPGSALLNVLAMGLMKYHEMHPSDREAGDTPLYDVAREGDVGDTLAVTPDGTTYFARDEDE